MQGDGLRDCAALHCGKVHLIERFLHAHQIVAIQYVRWHHLFNRVQRHVKRRSNPTTHPFGGEFGSQGIDRHQASHVQTLLGAFSKLMLRRAQLQPIAADLHLACHHNAPLIC